MESQSFLRILCFLLLCALFGFGQLIFAADQSDENDGVIDAAKHGIPIICYVGSWSRYRTGDGFFDASTFQNPNLCSHLIYAFIGLNESSHEVKILDPPAELGTEEGGKDGLKNYVNLRQKNPRLKVMVAIGGWNEGSEKYSAMAATSETRRTFIESVVNFMKKYEFDGFDIDWEYPTQRGGKLEDKDNFSFLVKEIRTAFNEYGWLLSVAIGAGKYILEEAYDIPTITKNVDFINLMSYDYHGKWENKTGHNAPLYEGANGHDALVNINSSINHLLKLGSLRNKLSLGLAFYGRTFTLDNAKDPSVGSPAHAPGPQGAFTQEANLMAYSEICREITSPVWVKSRDILQKVPYASNDKSWVSYDDEKSITEKVEFAVQRKLFGVMIWTVEMDDIQGKCHGVPMYLLKVINKCLMQDIDDTNVISDEKDNDKRGGVGRTNDGPGSYRSCSPLWMIVLFWVFSNYATH